LHQTGQEPEFAVAVWVRDEASAAVYEIRRTGICDVKDRGDDREARRTKGGERDQRPDL
jgi:hypothetical protein